MCARARVYDHVFERGRSWCVQCEYAPVDAFCVDISSRVCRVTVASRPERREAPPPPAPPRPPRAGR